MLVSNRVLAIDGGQTGTRAIVASAAGELEGLGVAGPSMDPGEFGRAIRDAVSQAGKIDAVVLGLTGVGISDETDSWYRETAAAATGSTNVLLESDAYTALVGAAGGRDGVLVVGGGGALALGVSRGTRVRAGGLGPMLIDEGSGYWLGLEAIRASWRAVEGWGPATALLGTVCEALGVQHIYDAKRRIHAGDVGFTEIARLAEAVGGVAQQGDRVAERLLTHAGGALAELALAVVRGTTWSDGPSVYASGRLLQDCAEVAHAFKARLESGAPGARLAQATYPPIVGAAIVGFRLVGELPSGEALEALTERWARATRPLG